MQNSTWMTGADISWHNPWWSKKSYYVVVYRSSYLRAHSLGGEKIYHGRKRLVCTKCNEISAQRCKLLQSRFRASKVYCKCYCPIHRDRCPLCRVSPKPRWPGCDGYISEEDMRFLNSLVPRPARWSRALGRKRKENLISDQRAR